MDKLVTTGMWMPAEMSLVALFVFIIIFSLGFTLWKSLSNSVWSLYWHISSFLTLFGSASLAIAASHVVTNLVVLGSAFAIVVSGVFSALIGAIIVVIKYLRFHRSM